MGLAVYVMEILFISVSPKVLGGAKEIVHLLEMLPGKWINLMAVCVYV
jgi:hypothetical protein